MGYGMPCDTVQSEHPPKNFSAAPAVNAMYTTLISAEQVMQLQQAKIPLMLFDCSFDLARSEAGLTMFAQSHMAGAVFADLDRTLSAKGERQSTDAQSGGRHPLPPRQALAQWLRDLGFMQGMQAVVYDRQGSSFCGRLWWMLRWLGHDAVAVLDGGLNAWVAAGGSTESGAESAFTVTQTGNFALREPLVKLLQVEEVLENLGRAGQTIMDARANPRFKGELEPLDPVAGHIPGALNRPFQLNLDADGKFKPPAQLRAEFEALLGARSTETVVHHCGSGVTAIPNILAMQIAGLGNTALFAGSWSEWCSDPARPVAKG
jgi:thiosulfate/3-mercaptopyruvate sulfurtransferase